MKLPKFMKEAIEHYVPAMEGWSTPERCCEMAACILETKAQVCLDIGVFAARSTMAMGFAARQLGTSHVYGVDAWNPSIASDNDDAKEGVDWWKKNIDIHDIHKQAITCIWDHHLDQWVTIIRAKSEYVHQLFPVLEFLNIDGGHSEATSCRDVELYLPRVKPGSYVMMDDTSWPSTQKALSMLGEQCELVNDTGEARTYRKR